MGDLLSGIFYCGSQGLNVLDSIFDSCIIQNGGLATNGNCTITNVGSFDSTAEGIIIYTNQLDVFNAYGKGNATVGLRTRGGRTATYHSTKPTITGATGDTMINGVVRAWGAMPFYDTTNSSGILNSNP